MMQALGPLVLLLAVLIGRAAAQQQQLGVSAAFPCSRAGEFFDTSSLECATCNQTAGYFPAPDQLGCVLCDPTNGSDMRFANGYIMSAAWGPSHLSAAGGCACTPDAAAAANGSAVSAASIDGGLSFQRCLTCPAGTRPDAAAGACLPPSGLLPTPAADLSYVIAALNARGAGILAQTATQAVVQGVHEASGAVQAYTIPQSLPLASWLGPAARACMDAGDRAACNCVANLCVLQMYNQDAAACRIYNELLAAAATPGRRASSSVGVSSGGLSPRPVTGALPWLHYQPGTPYLAAEDVDVEVSLSASARPLRFVLAAYDINGTWLGLHNWTLQLQLCGARVDEASLWTRFGVNYASSCVVDLSALLAQLDYSSTGPRFYDPYLLQESGLLYPLPVKLLNKLELSASASGLTADQETGHVRRFFFIDTLLATSAADGQQGGGAAATAPGPAAGSRAVVFPSSMSLVVTIRPDARKRIYPPRLTIGYSAVAVRPAGPSLAASFSAAYSNPGSLSGAFWSSWQTMLAVLLVLVGGPLWVWRVLLFMRHKANAPLDLELLLYGGLAAADALSAALVGVLLLVSVYWLVLIKLQESVLLLLLPDGQLYNFWVTVVLALVGQSCGLLWMLYEQTSVDIFFLDWEKPRRVLAKGGGREEAGPVSAWRSLLVANEWNELQTARLTHPAFTLLFAVFILDGANMAAAAYVHPDQADYARYQHVQQSMLLRFGIAAVWMVLLGVAQGLWKLLVVHRFAGHPLHCFIDLLFLSNTSAIILNHRHSGFYLHGRNQMHHSDTSLEELNGSLLREEEGLVAGRGLVSSYSGSGGGSYGGGGVFSGGPSAASLNDNQAFRLYMAAELRHKYESSLLAHVEQVAAEQRNNQGAITAAVRGPRRPAGSAIHAAEALSRLFRAALDEVERNHATQVLVPSYWQRLLRLPPPAAASGATTLLAHDLHLGFGSLLFFGQELRLFVYESLLFSALFMQTGSAAAAGLVTLLVQRLLAAARQHWGTHNLSRKTLVDRHFLI